ncbi:hypothetical protein THIOSC15_1830004 [uncultured Thiomicrorhabdus sp.]
MQLTLEDCVKRFDDTRTKKRGRAAAKKAPAKKAAAKKTTTKKTTAKKTATKKTAKPASKTSG